MGCTTIDASKVAAMFLAGAANLDAKKEWINELNVFPVPDGDTGTNMSMTIMSAAGAVAALNDPTLDEVAKAISTGSLRGARGNSGVILSQLFRGFAKACEGKKTVNAEIMADAFDKAVETAYKAVMKPKEGTILTVAKAGADKCRELYSLGEEDLEVYIDEIIAAEEKMLARTPEMLPVLKEAGVVDSGGQGLVVVLQGLRDAFQGKTIDYKAIEAAPTAKKIDAAALLDSDIKFGYCTEFIIMLTSPISLEKEQGFRTYLESIGDSIVLVADDELIKVHVHTNEPGNAIQKALTFGPLSNMKIDNMRLEHHENVIKMSEAQAAEQKKANEKKMPHKETGFVAVAAGAGLANIFRELGADYVIEGGQTMNPSTEDILDAIDKVNADTVFVLPNNKNIYLAANQAGQLCEDKKIVVLKTNTIPQGITALINYVPNMSAEENAEAMEIEFTRVKTGEVTYAVRDTSIDGHEIHQGDYMGIGDGKMKAVGKDMEEVILKMLESQVDEESALISIYYGEEISEDKAEELRQSVEKLYPDLDVELQDGGQPVYYYITSVE